MSSFYFPLFLVLYINWSICENMMTHPNGLICLTNLLSGLTKWKERGIFLEKKSPSSAEIGYWMKVSLFCSVNLKK